jgi:hypothetical protein
MRKPCTKSVPPPAAILFPPAIKFVHRVPLFCAWVLCNLRRHNVLGQASPFLKTFLLRNIPIRTVFVLAILSFHFLCFWCDSAAKHILKSFEKNQRIKSLDFAQNNGVINENCVSRFSQSVMGALCGAHKKNYKAKNGPGCFSVIAPIRRSVGVD